MWAERKVDKGLSGRWKKLNVKFLVNFKKVPIDSEDVSGYNIGMQYCTERASAAIILSQTVHAP